MIHVEIRGGLGNQMFEYAFARNIQEKTGQDICLHISYLDEDKIGTKRKYELDNFQLNPNVKTTYEKLPLIVDNFRNPAIKILKRLFPKLCFNFFHQFGAYIWKENTYINFKISPKKNYYLLGFWQSEKYFFNIKETLIKEFVLRKVSDEFIKAKREISNMDDAVCIHIRRGDFVGSNHEVCDMNYYRDCINYFTERKPNTSFVFFSDDVQWVQSMFSDLQNSYIVSENIIDYEQMMLMSLCKHYILSNSSFGWWGQYLNADKNKTVLAPSRWYIDSYDRSIYQDNWVVMEKR